MNHPMPFSYPWENWEVSLNSPGIPVYCLSNDGVLTISGTGAMDNYCVKKYGYIETYIDAPWDSARSIIHTVIIEDGVTNIGEYAFDNLSALKTVILADSVVKIGEGAFKNCASLNTVETSVNLNIIDDLAFYQCTSLQEINLRNNISVIGHQAFNYNSSLTNVTIPDTIKSIGYSAFSNCTSLSHIYYDGSEAEWDDVISDSDDFGLTSAHIHYNADLYPSHVLTMTSRPAACTTIGYDHYSCSCGISYIENETAALGHVEIIVDAVLPTCTEAGLTEGKQCSVCSEMLVIQEPVSAVGHKTELQGYIAATETAEGYSGDEVCTVCGVTVVIGSVIPITGLGDSDGSGSVDMFDAKLVLEYYAGIVSVEEINVRVSDVDGNGDVDMFDAMMILEFYAGSITEFSTSK